MRIENINTRHDLAKFVGKLAKEASTSIDKWENREISTYLSAMAGWIEDMDGYYLNLGESVPQQPSWKIIAQLIKAAMIYE